MHENFDYIYQIKEMDELKKKLFFANKLKDCDLKQFSTICIEIFRINKIIQARDVLVNIWLILL